MVSSDKNNHYCTSHKLFAVIYWYMQHEQLSVLTGRIAAFSFYSTVGLDHFHFYDEDYMKLPDRVNIEVFCSLSLK